jgi:hypothetical protein
VSKSHEDRAPGEPDPLDDDPGAGADQPGADDPDPPPAPPSLSIATSPGDVVQAVADFVDDLVEDTEAPETSDDDER